MRKYNSRPGLKGVDTGVRKASPTYGKEAFITFVEKGGGTLVFDNDAERLVAHMLGFDPRVRRIQAQPFAVDLVAGELLRTAEERKAARSMYGARKGASIYTPDFYVERADGKQLAVEVKLGGFVGGDADHERLNLATQVLAHYGHEVARVVFPNTTHHPLRFNIGLLHAAAQRLDLRPDDELAERVHHLADRGARTLFDFARGLGLSVNLIPALIVYGVLSADLIDSCHRPPYRSQCVIGM
ncbi:MAG: hypothetical protein QM788_05190 [Roseateles sp.]|uniref:hypothetical protein n=1 Tax=Roseateles sp. TaxID=1971397 RepID=UPI0039E8FD0F